jgi:hypothetical protein
MAGVPYLPLEMIYEIYSYLTKHIDRDRFRNACSTWRAALPSPPTLCELMALEVSQVAIDNNLWACSECRLLRPCHNFNLSDLSIRMKGNRGSTHYIPRRICIPCGVEADLPCYKKGSLFRVRHTYTDEFTGATEEVEEFLVRCTRCDKVGLLDDREFRWPDSCVDCHYGVSYAEFEEEEESEFEEEEEAESEDEEGELEDEEGEREYEESESEDEDGEFAP